MPMVLGLQSILCTGCVYAPEMCDEKAAKLAGPIHGCSTNTPRSCLFNLWIKISVFRRWTSSSSASVLLLWTFCETRHLDYSAHWSGFRLLQQLEYTATQDAPDLCRWHWCGRIFGAVADAIDGVLPNVQTQNWLSRFSVISTFPHLLCPILSVLGTNMVFYIVHVNHHILWRMWAISIILGGWISLVNANFLICGFYYS